MKSTIAIALLMIMSSTFLVNLGVITWFQIENNRIVLELCENRNVKNSTCHGNCVLDKKLNLSQSENNRSEDKLPIRQIENLHFILPVENIQNSNSISAIFHRPVYFNPLEGVNSKIFRPPAIA